MKIRSSIKFLGVVGFAQIVMAGCSSTDQGTTDDPAAAPGVTASTTKVVAVDAEGVATFVTGDLGSAPRAPSLGQTAMSGVLSGIAQHFRMSEANLVLRSEQHDALGDTHYRFGQKKNGRDVIGAELIVHARDGRVYAANGTVREDLKDRTPGALLATADAIVAAHTASSAHSGVAINGTPDLAYLQEGVALTLVYRVDVTGVQADQTPVHDTLLINAATGDVAGRIPHIYTAEKREVHNAKNGSALPGAVSRTEGQAAGTEASVNGNYDNLGNTYDCYKQLFNRDSYDNQGAKLVSSVHYSLKYNNAYWDGTQMVYGDGDGKVLANLATTIDVTAHELTHAVTGDTSNLTYSGQSGGLNESMSDIFGNTCEWFAAGKPATPPAGTWQIGETCYTPATPGDALRYMDDPTKDGSSLDYYPDYDSSVDVHYSSGISNLAFYLLAHGGSHPHGKTTVTVTGVGIEKAAQIFYRANTTIFTASTTFAAARTGTEQAAAQLGYGADVIASVTAAWQAVGVGSAAPPPPPPPKDAGAPDANVPKDSGPSTDAAPPKDAGPAPDAGAPTSTCTHSECSTGTKLKKTCDTCVGKICAADSYCCNTRWDSICVGEVASICNATCN